MTPSDLSPIMRIAYESLSEEDRAAFLEEQKTSYCQSIRGAIAQVQARNTSHHIGNYVKVTQKKD